MTSMLSTGLALLSFAFLSGSVPEAQHLCAGAVPPNDLEIPVPEIGAFATGLTEKEFNSALDKIANYYSQGGAKIHVNRNWASSQVNAFALMDKQGRRQIYFYGGLARHPAVTEDGFLLIACHEVGHHFGGSPRRTGLTRDKWASIEGQSDYFATLKCMRKIFATEDNRAFLAGKTVDPYADSECRRQFSDEKNLDICRRSSLAQQSLTALFADLAREPIPDFMKPDPTVAKETFEGHPNSQCRLDTLFQASLCTANPDESLSGSDPYRGACSASQGHDRGLRPLCWYKP